MANSDIILPSAVIGLGVAGVGAAVYLSRMGVQPVGFEFGPIGGLVNEAPRVDDYPGFKGTGNELSKKLAAQLAENQIEVIKEKVTGLSRTPKGVFAIQTDHAVYRAYAVVVATGMRFLTPDIAGMQDIDPSFVSHADVSDAPLAKGKDVVVWGFNDRGFQAAEYLASFAAKVTLVAASLAPVSANILERVKALNNVRIVLGAVVKAENFGQGELVTLKTAVGTKEEIRADKLFVFLDTSWQKPNTEFLAIREVEDDQGNIAVDSYAKTFIPGLFAAGDVQQKDLRKISTAASDGAMAGIMAYKYVTDLKDSGKIKDME